MLIKVEVTHLSDVSLQLRQRLQLSLLMLLLLSRSNYASFNQMMIALIALAFVVHDWVVFVCLGQSLAFCSLRKAWEMA